MKGHEAQLTGDSPAGEEEEEAQPFNTDDLTPPTMKATSLKA